jgi:hypothetical protein
MASRTAIERAVISRSVIEHTAITRGKVSQACKGAVEAWRQYPGQHREGRGVDCVRLDFVWPCVIRPSTARASFIRNDLGCLRPRVIQPRVIQRSVIPRSVIPRSVIPRSAIQPGATRTSSIQPSPGPRPSPPWMAVHALVRQARAGQRRGLNHGGLNHGGLNHDGLNHGPHRSRGRLSASLLASIQCGPPRPNGSRHPGAPSRRTGYSLRPVPRHALSAMAGHQGGLYQARP